MLTTTLFLFIRSLSR